MFGRVKVAIMGTGKIAGVMAETLKSVRGATFYAVGSRTQDSADKFAQAHGVKKAYGSYEELLADPKVDLVYVATPHSEHYKNVRLALMNGKNVLCEKAFMLNERQAEDIFNLADEKKLLVVEAMWTRFHPMRKKLDEILASNVIGETTMLTANLGYNIREKDRIKLPELGGGALLDLGVYTLNFASMVFGNEVTDIVSMCSFNEQGMDLHDSITLRYKNGKMAVLNASALSVSDRKGVIYGSTGFIWVIRGQMILNILLLIISTTLRVSPFMTALTRSWHITRDPSRRQDMSMRSRHALRRSPTSGPNALRCRMKRLLRCST